VGGRRPSVAYRTGGVPPRGRLFRLLRTGSMSAFGEVQRDAGRGVARTLVPRGLARVGPIWRPSGTNRSFSAGEINHTALFGPGPPLSCTTVVRARPRPPPDVGTAHARGMPTPDSLARHSTGRWLSRS